MNQIRTIDIHSHFLPQSYLDALREMGVSPAEEDGFPTPAWSVEKHVAFMDQAGIQTSVLSLSTPHIHRGNDSQACDIARAINLDASAICRQYPERFQYAACLPFPAVEGSIEEIRYNYDVLNAIAVKVPSNANGVYLGDPVLDPVFEELNRRKAIVIIHPSKAPTEPKGIFTAGPAPLFEYIVDTTRAVLNMISHGVLERYPDIKVIVPHCGSYLPFVMHRLIGISKVLIPNGTMEDIDVRASFSKLYFDMAGDALPVALDALLKITDPSHILYGSDYPYTPVPAVLNNRNKFEQYEPIKDSLEAMFRTNAMNLFGL